MRSNLAKLRFSEPCSMPAVEETERDIPDCGAPTHLVRVLFPSHPRPPGHLVPHTAEDCLCCLTRDNPGTAWKFPL
jgi:hypothetical protein